MGGQKSLGTF